MRPHSGRGLEMRDWKKCRKSIERRVSFLSIRIRRRYKSCLILCTADAKVSPIFRIRQCRRSGENFNYSAVIVIFSLGRRRRGHVRLMPMRTLACFPGGTWRLCRRDLRIGREKSGQPVSVLPLITQFLKQKVRMIRSERPTMHLVVTHYNEAAIQGEGPAFPNSGTVPGCRISHQVLFCQ